VLDGLNRAQREAVIAPEGPLLILAGAGSGKTRVLTRRIAYSIKRGRRHPREVLALTFTNKAAREMTDRIGQLMGGDEDGAAACRQMAAGTFHAVANRLIVRSHAEQLGRTSRFTILTGSDQDQALKLAIAHADVGRFPVGEVRLFIGTAKSTLLDPAAAKQRAGDDSHRRLLADVYEAYEDITRKANGLDFDDLLMGAVRILEQDDELRWQLAHRLQSVYVDEYQDTNAAQYRRLRLLTPHNNVTVVGDHQQAIFGFRGADARNILAFERDFPSARVVLLVRNYRSTPQILEVANSVISKATEGRDRAVTLHAASPDGPRVVREDYGDDREEARSVATWALRHLKAGAEPGDLAVLYYGRSQARLLQEELMLARVPFRVEGSMGIYERTEVRDALAWLFLVNNPYNRIAFERAVQAPRRGIGPAAIARVAHCAYSQGVDLLEACRRAASIDKLRTPQVETLIDFGHALAELAAKVDTVPLKQLVGDVLVVSGLPGQLKRAADRGSSRQREQAAERLDRLRDLVRLAGGFDDEEERDEPATLSEFLAEASLATGRDADESDRQRVTLSTMHKAKGLEWPYVRLIAWEEGVLPHRYSLDDGPAAIEEDRRLAYVALTRAQRELTISWARTRDGHPRKPSRFLIDTGLGAL